MSATSTSASTSTPISPVRVELQTAFAPQTPQELLQLCADWIAHNEDSDQPIDRDVYGAGSHISAFQSRVATTCGFPAGLFMVSGVMSQLIALKIHTRGKNPIFACHPKSHLELHEQGAYEHVLQLSRVYFCGPNEIGSATSITQAISAHWKQPAVIVIEIPNREIGGQCPTWEELLAIREMCDQRGIKLHLDGARLWEARPFYRKSYAEICSVFDSVYVSFYKGLGAMTGAMLLGSEEFIAEAKIWQRRFGGNLYTSLPYVAHADLCFTHHLSSFPVRAAKLQRVVVAITEAVKKECGDASPLRFNPPVPHCSMVHAHITGLRSAIDAAHATVASRDGISVFNRIRPFDANESYLEWNMGPHNIEIEDDVFVRGWLAFVKELKQQQSQIQTQTQTQTQTQSS